MAMTRDAAQLAKNTSTAATSLEIQVQMDRPLDGSMSLVIFRNGTSIGNASNSLGGNVYSFIDSSPPTGTLNYTARVVQDSYTGPVSATYTVTKT